MLAPFMKNSRSLNWIDSEPTMFLQILGEDGRHCICNPSKRLEMLCESVVCRGHLLPGVVWAAAGGGDPVPSFFFEPGLRPSLNAKSLREHPPPPPVLREVLRAAVLHRRGFAQVQGHEGGGLVEEGLFFPAVNLWGG